MRREGIRRTAGVLLRMLVPVTLAAAVWLTVTQAVLPACCRKQAEEQTAQIVKEYGIGSFSYTGAGPIDNRQDFAREVFALAAWEKEQRAGIEEVLGQGAAPLRYRKGPFFVPTAAFYLWEEKQTEKKRSEDRLAEAVQNSIRELYERAGASAPIPEVWLTASWLRGDFDLFCREAEKAAENHPEPDEKLYEMVADIVCRGDREECVPVDFLYILKPEELPDSYRVHLQAMIDREDLDPLKDAIEKTSALEERYQICHPLMEQAKSLRDTLEKEKQEAEERKKREEYEAKPRIPEVWDQRNPGTGTKASYSYHPYSSTQKAGDRKTDPFDVYDFDDPDDFADEWAEEFGDGDFDEGWEDAWDYWQDHRG